jgi:hypothetical protein
MDIYVIDGTYELFRYFYAVPSAKDNCGQEIGAVRGVLGSVLSMIEGGATHVGVATDVPMDEPSVWISDAKGIDRVIVSTEGLRLANDSGRPAASVTFTNKKGAEILLHNADGKLLYHAP